MDAERRYTNGERSTSWVVKRRTIRNANRWGVRRGQKMEEEEEETRKGRRGTEDSLSRAPSRCLLPVRRVFAYPRHDQDPICIAPMKLLPSYAACESFSRRTSVVGDVRGCTPGVVQVVDSPPKKFLGITMITTTVYIPG